MSAETTPIAWGSGRATLSGTCAAGWTQMFNGVHTRLRFVLVFRHERLTQDAR